MTAVRRAGHIAVRELAVEASGREMGAVVLPFVLGALLLAGLAFGPRTEILHAVGPGLSWLIVLFAAVPLVRTVAAAERDDGCWYLLTALASPAELLAGKVTALTLWFLCTWGASTVLVAVLLGSSPGPAGMLAGPLGAVGLAAVAVTFGVVTAGSDRGHGLLSVLLGPAVLPVLLAGAQAGAPGPHPWPWLALMAAYDVVALAVAWALFPVLLEE